MSSLNIWNIRNAGEVRKKSSVGKETQKLSLVDSSENSIDLFITPMQPKKQYGCYGDKSIVSTSLRGLHVAIILVLLWAHACLKEVIKEKRLLPL